MKYSHKAKCLPAMVAVVLLVCPCVSLLFAQAESPTTSIPSPPGNPVTAEPNVAWPPEQPAPQPKSDQKNFVIEFAGIYNAFVPGAGSANWRGWDSRLLYTGFKRFTPFGSAASLGDGSGSQQSFGAGSYVTINKWFYIIGGFSYSPESKVLFSPHSRFDIAGMLSVPRVKGLVFSIGLTELPAYKNTNGGRIIALGDLYYWRRFIFGGSVNLNFSQPGDQHSVSGQFSATYGTRGKYYVGGGMSGGKVAYQLITGVPFDIRYQTVAGFGTFSKWVTRHTGVNLRYDYQKIIGSYQRHAIRAGVFYEF